MQGEGSGEKPQAEIQAQLIRDRATLEGMLDPLFVSMWTDFLNLAFEWFPHARGDGSQNERTFIAIRHRVLRTGNANKREMSNILRAFAVKQVADRTVERHEVKGSGPFNLPPNVRMPESDRRPTNVRGHCTQA